MVIWLVNQYDLNLFTNKAEHDQILSISFCNDYQKLLLTPISEIRQLSNIIIMHNVMNMLPPKHPGYEANKAQAFFKSDPLEQQDTNRNSQAQSYDTPQIKCRKLTEINQNLSYNISLLEVQLQALKRVQQQKMNDNKKIKDKVKQRLDKQQQTKRHLKLQNQKINKLLNGLKLLNKQADDMVIKEQKTRQKRLNAQQAKIQKYQDYNKVEQQYRQFIYSIKQLDGLFEGLAEAEQKNQSMKIQIKQIEDCLDEENSTREDAMAIKKERNNKIKQLNAKVLELQREENYLTSEIAKIERSQRVWENERQKIEQKSAQAINLYQKIQEAKSTLISKKSQFTEIDSAYKQLCIEQNRLKKEMILERECRQQQKKYKQAIRKKPSQALESSKMEVKQHSPIKSVPMQDSAFNKLQSIVKRFENIKNKNNN